MASIQGHLLGASTFLILPFCSFMCLDPVQQLKCTNAALDTNKILLTQEECWTLGKERRECSGQDNIHDVKQDVIYSGCRLKSGDSCVASPCLHQANHWDGLKDAQYHNAPAVQNRPVALGSGQIDQILDWCRSVFWRSCIHSSQQISFKAGILPGYRIIPSLLQLVSLWSSGRYCKSLFVTSWRFPCARLFLSGCR